MPGNASGSCLGITPCVAQPGVPTAPVRLAMYSVSTPLPDTSPNAVSEMNISAEPSTAALVRPIYTAIVPPALSGGETSSYPRPSGKLAGRATAGAHSAPIAAITHADTHQPPFPTNTS